MVDTVAAAPGGEWWRDQVTKHPEAFKAWIEKNGFHKMNGVSLWDMAVAAAEAVYEAHKAAEKTASAHET